MALVLNEEQQLLKESAAGFFAEKSPVSSLRQLRDDMDEAGYSKDLWSEMTEMGFAGLIIDEDHGGVDFGYTGAGIVAEEMGKNLTSSPYFASSVLAASLIASAGSDAQKETMLPLLASGEKIMTLAVDETGHHGPENTKVKAVESGGSWSLSGLKTFVPEGHVADQILVLARTSGEAGDSDGLTVFIVDRGASGCIVDRTVLADSRNWAKITFEGAVAADVLGDVGGAMKFLSPVLAKANIVLAAEMLGIAQEVFDRTMEYLKERKQFGQIIGTYQGLQHRAAHWFSEIEVTRSAVLKALHAADANKGVELMASIAKARACKTVELATNEGIQMHGGIGMTDEFEIGFYIKRARSVQNLYGGFAYHTDKYARLCGY